MWKCRPYGNWEKLENKSCQNLLDSESIVDSNHLKDYPNSPANSTSPIHVTSKGHEGNPSSLFPSKASIGILRYFGPQK